MLVEQVQLVIKKMVTLILNIIFLGFQAKGAGNSCNHHIIPFPGDIVTDHQIQMRAMPEWLLCDFGLKPRHRGNCCL
jgi:hypothetical protein